MIEIDVLIETYRVCKEYIPQKDRQTAADHVVNAINEYDISEEDLRLLAATDSYVRRAAEEYLGEEFDIAHDEEDEEY
jgi:hypothetical protein